MFVIVWDKFLFLLLKIKKGYKMKKVIICLLLGLFGCMMIYADESQSENSPEQQMTKAQKKALEKRHKEIIDSLNHSVATKAMKKGYYVLMADRMMMKNHAYMNPSSNTNFLLVQGDEAVIQIASNRSNPGLNGLGGITVKGKITGLKGGEPDKKGKISYSFTVTGPAVSAQVHITLYKEDNQATAIVSPNFWSGNLTIYGRVVPYNEKDYEKAFEGTSFP